MNETNLEKGCGHFPNIESVQKIDKQLKIEKNHKRISKELGLDEDIENLSKLGRIINKTTYAKGEAVQISRGKKILYVAKRYDEEYWIIHDVQWKNKLIERYYQVGKKARKKLEHRIPKYIIKSSDIIDWILRVAGLITLISGGG